MKEKPTRFVGVSLAASAFFLLLLTAQLALATEPPDLADVIDGIDIEDEFENSIGLPLNLNDDLDHSQIREGCESLYCFALSGETKGPIWVMEKMSPDIAIGSNKRPSGWRMKRLGGIKSARDSDYTHSGYARGHNAASDDFKASRDWMKETFTFANALPQIQDGFNGSYWRFLEEDVKHLAEMGNVLYVVTGPVPLADDGKAFTIEASGESCKHDVTMASLKQVKQGFICGGSKADGPNQQCEAGVSVPAGMFKVVYIKDSHRAFGYAAANIDHRSEGDKFDHHDDYIETWRVSIEDIEKATNLSFFPNLPKRERRNLTRGCIATPGH